MKGQVYKSTGSWYLVKDENGGFWQCRTKGKLRLEGSKSTNPVSVGDWVLFEEDKQGNPEEGIIYEILNRKNYLLRKSTNLSKQTHVIAANVDLLFLVVTLQNPTTSFGFIDRFMVMAEAFNVDVHILINKWDAYDDATLKQAEVLTEVYERIGYKVSPCSVITGLNMDLVKKEMHEKTVVFSGHSGVGKSSILQIIAPNLKIRIGDTSVSHQKGKHTTTFAEMFDLGDDIRVIDTPGIKGFGLTKLEKHEISLYFREMKNLLDGCKFYNCKHINEPKCAVKAGLESGEIAESRYTSYINMIEDDDGSYRSNKFG